MPVKTLQQLCRALETGRDVRPFIRAHDVPSVLTVDRFLELFVRSPAARPFVRRALASVNNVKTTGYRRISRSCVQALVQSQAGPRFVFESRSLRCDRWQLAGIQLSEFDDEDKYWVHWSESLAEIDKMYEDNGEKRAELPFGSASRIRDAHLHALLQMSQESRSEPEFSSVSSSASLESLDIDLSRLRLGLGDVLYNECKSYGSGLDESAEKSNFDCVDQSEDSYWALYDQTELIY